MKFIFKTQIVAIIFSISWVLYLILLAFFNHPDRAIRYINWFVYGLALVLGVIYFFLTKRLIGRKWVAIPLVLIPYYLLYKPISILLLNLFTNQNAGDSGVIQFFYLTTGTVNLMTTIIGLVLGIWFSKYHK